MIFIAEAKTHSPYWERRARSWHDMIELALEKGDWVSVLVDRQWGGHVSDVGAAALLNERREDKKKILAKGFHPTVGDIDLSLKMGADYVLVVGWLPPERYWDKVLVECESLEQLETLPRQVKAVWNSRDPRTGESRAEQGQGIYVARSVRPRGWLCQASGIRTWADVDPDVDAFIVGEHLEDFE